MNNQQKKITDFIQNPNSLSYTHPNKKNNYKINSSDSEVVRVHKLQVYCKVVKSSMAWSNRHEVLSVQPNYKKWKWGNNETELFFVNGVETRFTAKKIVFILTGLKGSSAVSAKKGLSELLFSLKASLEKRFSIELNPFFVITEQEIAHERDEVARIVNAAGKKGKIGLDGRFLLEIRDRKGEKRAHVDLSDLDEFETVHARHSEDDMDGYLKHFSDAKKNNLRKQFADWMFKNPPTLSYQYKVLKDLELRGIAQDELVKKIEVTTSRTTESLYTLSEAISRMAQAWRR